MKYYNGLNMGEGIAGTSEIGASTTKISSCMGIALVDRKRKMGGLYHYPADMIANPNVAGTIRQMANDISPDEIVLTPARSSGFGFMSGSTQEDIEAVTKFLGNLCKTVTVLSARSSAQLIWKGESPVFNEIPDNVSVEAEVPQTCRATMSSGPRKLEANVWYYGGDGETEGVLEQGLLFTKNNSGTLYTI